MTGSRNPNSVMGHSSDPFVYNEGIRPRTFGSLFKKMGQS